MVLSILCNCIIHVVYLLLNIPSCVKHSECVFQSVYKRVPSTNRILVLHTKSYHLNELDLTKLWTVYRLQFTSGKSDSENYEPSNLQVYQPESQMLRSNIQVQTLLLEY